MAKFSQRPSDLDPRFSIRSAVLWIFIAIGFAMFPSTLMANSVEVIKLEDQPWYEAEDKAIAREIVSPRNSSAKSLSIAEIKIPVGIEVVPHHHKMEEIYHVVSGSGLMMVEDRYQQIEAGDTVVIAPHQWHNIKNNGDEELRLVVTCVPAWAPEHLKFERTGASR
ncbi:MAG: cupin domain-containing protein [Pseudomonadota bacterium]